MLGIFLSFLLVGINSAWAPCPNVTLTVTNSTHDFNTNVLASLGATVTRANGAQRCDFFLGYSRGSSTTYSPRNMSTAGNFEFPYDVRRTSSPVSDILQDYPDANNINQVHTGVFAAGGGSTQNFNYFGHLSAPFSIFNVRRFGTFTDTIEINLYESDFPPTGIPVLRDSKTTTFTYTVDKIALMTLVNTGAGYSDPPTSVRDINFGSITAGQSQSFDLVLLYNAGYEVNFESTHGQRLKHASMDSYVPYTIQVGAFTPTLIAATPVTVVSGFGVSPSAPNGDARAVTVTIGSLANSFAGNYSESITITLSSIE